MQMKCLIKFRISPATFNLAILKVFNFFLNVAIGPDRRKIAILIRSLQPIWSS